MNISVLPSMQSSSDSMTDVLMEFVDPFFIDSASASIEMPSGSLLTTFCADFFGEYKLTKEAVGILRDDLRQLASVAAELFERKMTECASHGAIQADLRPVNLPDGVEMVFVPSLDA